MTWFCSVCENSFSRKDRMQSHVMSKHRNAGLTPFQTVPWSAVSSQKSCQRFSNNNNNNNGFLTDPLGGSSLLNYINYNYKLSYLQIMQYTIKSRSRINRIQLQ